MALSGASPFLLTFLHCEGCDARFLFAESKVIITQSEIRIERFPAPDHLKFTLGFIQSGHCKTCLPPPSCIPVDHNSIIGNELIWLLGPRRFQGSKEIPVYTKSSQNGSFDARLLHLSAETKELGLTEGTYRMLKDLTPMTGPVAPYVEPSDKSILCIGEEVEENLDSMLEKGYQLARYENDGYRWMSMTEIALQVGSFRVYRQHKDLVIPLTVCPTYKTGVHTVLYPRFTFRNTNCLEPRCTAILELEDVGTKLRNPVPCFDKNMDPDVRDLYLRNDVVEYGRLPLARLEEAGFTFDELDGAEGQYEEWVKGVDRFVMYDLINRSMLKAIWVMKESCP